MSHLSWKNTITHLSNQSRCDISLEVVFFMIIGKHPLQLLLHIRNKRMVRQNRFIRHNPLGLLAALRLLRLVKNQGLVKRPLHKGILAVINAFSPLLEDHKKLYIGVSAARSERITSSAFISKREYRNFSATPEGALAYLSGSNSTALPKVVDVPV